MAAPLFSSGDAQARTFRLVVNGQTQAPLRAPVAPLVVRAPAVLPVNGVRSYTGVAMPWRANSIARIAAPGQVRTFAFATGSRTAWGSRTGWRRHDNWRARQHSADGLSAPIPTYMPPDPALVAMYGEEALAPRYACSGPAIYELDDSPRRRERNMPQVIYGAANPCAPGRLSGGPGIYHMR